MYGRCETDPFDQATDVCDSCYGEFCSACMVKTKGRRHPICKACAIIASGVRPGAKPLLRGSKKTAAERRQGLQERTACDRAFAYFDDVSIGPDHPEPVPEQLDEATVLESAPAESPALSEPPAPMAEPVVGPEPEPTVEDDVVRPTAGLDGMPQPRVTPGLAALAQHQADRRVTPRSSGPADRADEANRAEPAAPVERRRPEDKPVTDGFDWVTEMPPRGSSPALPSRSGPRSAGEEPVPATGAVATADRPATELPRRRSRRPSPDHAS